MSKLDIFLAVAIAFITFLGYWHGLVKSLLRIVALLLSGGITMMLVDSISKALTPSFPTAASLVAPLTGAILFGVTYFATLILISLLSHLSEDNNYSIFNRLLGAVFGLGKGLLFCWIILSGLHMFANEGYMGEVQRDSKFYHSYLEKKNPTR